jgi:tetratricopeptide (TPR) repeat protein
VLESPRIIDPPSGQHLQAPIADPFAAFDAANKLYEQSKFAAAAEGYSRLVESGAVSAPLLFNLGNACFKSGQLGQAIAVYRQAKRLAPRDPDITANLQFARGQIQGPTLAPDRWETWLNRLTLNEWAWLASTSIWVLFVLLAVAQFRPSLRSALRNTLIACAVVAVLLCALAGASFRLRRVERIATVITPEAVAHNGPLEESPNAFTLYNGAEVRVLDSKDGWLMVSTDPRRTGWVRQDKLLLPRAD